MYIKEINQIKKSNNYHGDSGRANAELPYRQYTSVKLVSQTKGVADIAAKGRTKTELPTNILRE